MTSKATLRGTQSQLGQTRTSRYLLPQEITLDPDFQYRHRGSDKAHVRTLAQTLRTVGDLDPVLIWQEVDTDGLPTGRLVLLDGHHRLAAIATAKGRPQGITAEVFEGDRAQAMIEALKANTRDVLPLTKSERMDAAWRLVRLPGKRSTVLAIARAAGVGPATVDRMRKRWSAMNAAGSIASGSWWRDQRDVSPDMDDQPEMTDKEREALIERLVSDLRTAFDRMPWRDEEIAALALQRSVGTYKLRTMTEQLFGSGFEFDDDERASTYWGPLEEPETDTTGQLF